MMTGTIIQRVEKSELIDDTIKINRFDEDVFEVLGFDYVPQRLFIGSADQCADYLNKHYFNQ